MIVTIMIGVLLLCGAWWLLVQLIAALVRWLGR
jgi:hypothetical protein